MMQHLLNSISNLHPTEIHMHFDLNWQDLIVALISAAIGWFTKHFQTTSTPTPASSKAGPYTGAGGQ